MKKKKKAEQEKIETLLATEKETLISRHPLAALMVIAFLLLLIFYSQVMLAGKTFQMPDQQSSRATAPFVKAEELSLLKSFTILLTVELETPKASPMLSWSSFPCAVSTTESATRVSSR